MTFGVLIDLDQTLVDSSRLKPLRDARNWRDVRMSLDLSSVYPYAVSFLESLSARGLTAGIVTSSPRPYAEDLVRHHGLPIRVVTAYHDTRMHKPHAAPLLHGLSVLGTEAGVYVGDDDIDARAAAAAGLAFVRVDHTRGEPLRELVNVIVDIASRTAR